MTLIENKLIITPVGLIEGMKYQLIMPSNAVKDSFDHVNQDINIIFSIYEPIKLLRVGSGSDDLFMTKIEISLQLCS